MDTPLTAVLSAIAFGVVSILIILFLVKEMYKHYSKKENDNHDNNN
ncbi:hypothetical protein [Persephonella sp. IF05-L8]